MVTIPQINQIFQFLKYIAGGLGFVIVAVFYGTVYTVNYTNNTAHTLDTMSRTMKQINYNQVNYQNTANEHFKTLDNKQSDMASDIQFIMDNIPYKRVSRK